MTDLSDTPAGMVARLDAALARRGMDVVLRRVTMSGATEVNADVTVRAKVDAVGEADVVGTIKLNDLKIILSPTQIAAAGWPGGAGGGDIVSPSDPRVPKDTDYIVGFGRRRKIKLVDAKFMPTLVRINLVVEG